MSRKKKRSRGKTPTDRAAVLHFTVGSLPDTKNASKGGFFNFEHEIELLKAALLYADRVRMCSVGGAFMSGLDDLSNMSLSGKLALIRKYMPVIYSEATPEELRATYQLMESVKGGRVVGGRGKESVQKMFAARKLLEEEWSKIEGRIQEEYQGVGAEGFREALQSGLVKLSPFTHISAEKIMDMGFAADRGLLDVANSDETYDEYLGQVLDAVGNGGTYPLFDDLTGNIVGEAVRNGVILPSQGDAARGRQGGLSGDLLRRLPLFEEATVADVLDIRRELSDYLDAFRLAVAQYAEVIGSALWDEDFAEEAARVFREKVAPTVREIERAVEENRELRELSWRFAPPMAAAGFVPTVNAFVGNLSTLADVAMIAAGLTGGALVGAVAVRKERKELEGNQLYFYYDAGRRLRGLGPRR